MTTSSAPVTIDDPINVQLLAVSEDRIEGFQRDPIGEIAQRADLAPDIVLERLRAMLAAGTIRRIRQTMVSTNLASGALIAWQVPEDRLQAAFDHMFQNDPFSGHVVIRTSGAATVGARYRLWDHAQSARGVFAHQTLPAPCRPRRRHPVSHHAGQAPLPPRRRTHPSP